MYKRQTLRQAPVFLFVAAVALLPIAVVLGAPLDPLVAYGVLVASLFVCMACATMFSIQGISFIQLETPAHLVGKVIALAMSLANCAQPVGQLVYGGLFDALRGNLVPVALGTAAAALVIAALTNRVLKRGLTAEGTAVDAVEVSESGALPVAVEPSEAVELPVAVESVQARMR